MMKIVLPILEAEREKMLQSRGDRKRKYVKNDGRKRKVYARQKFLMTLIYLRQNVNHTVVGEMFGGECRHFGKCLSRGTSDFAKRISLAEMGSREKVAESGGEMESIGSGLFDH